MQDVEQLVFKPAFKDVFQRFDSALFIGIGIRHQKAFQQFADRSAFSGICFVELIIFIFVEDFVDHKRKQRGRRNVLVIFETLLIDTELIFNVGQLAVIINIAADFFNELLINCFSESFPDNIRTVRKSKLRQHGNDDVKELVGVIFRECSAAFGSIKNAVIQQVDEFVMQPVAAVLIPVSVVQHIVDLPQFGQNRNADFRRVAVKVFNDENRLAFLPPVRLFFYFRFL